MKKRNTTTFVFLVLFFLSFGVFFLSKNGIDPLRFIFEPIISGLRFSFKINSPFVNDELESLRKENRELASRLLKLSELGRENKALRDQFETSSTSSFKLLPSKIVGLPGFVSNVSEPEYLIVDSGKESKVREGSIVIYNSAVVGIVDLATNTYSRVKLITNSKFIMSAKSLKTSAIGIAKGYGAGKMVFENVLTTENIEKNDFVVTKGDLDEKGKGIPPDFILGKITSVEKRSSDLLQKAQIESIIDFKKLERVFIIIS